MGTDVELYVERLRHDQWVPVHPPEGTVYAECADVEQDLVLLAQSYEKDPVPTFAQSWYIWRNYDLFGLLAGVRRYDFQFKPLAGLPHDVSDYVRDEHQISHGHSCTHYTVHELKLYLPTVKSQRYKKEATNVLLELLKELNTLQLRYNLNDHQIRIVMWFD